MIGAERGCFLCVSTRGQDGTSSPQSGLQERRLPKPSHQCGCLKASTQMGADFASKTHGPRGLQRTRAWRPHGSAGHFSFFDRILSLNQFWYVCVVHDTVCVYIHIKEQLGAPTDIVYLRHQSFLCPYAFLVHMPSASFAARRLRQEGV